MIIFHKRTGPSTWKPKQSYEDWKADRQQYIDSQTPMQVFDNLRYQAMNKNDDFYFGLGNRIRERQAAKIPIAGEGAVMFLEDMSDIAKWASVVNPLLRPLYLMTRTTEEIVRWRSGMPSRFGD